MTLAFDDDLVALNGGDDDGGSDVHWEAMSHDDNVELDMDRRKLAHTVDCLARLGTGRPDEIDGSQNDGVVADVLLTNSFETTQVFWSLSQIS